MTHGYYEYRTKDCHVTTTIGHGHVVTFHVRRFGYVVQKTYRGRTNPIRVFGQLTILEAAARAIDHCNALQRSVDQEAGVMESASEALKLLAE